MTTQLQVDFLSFIEQCELLYGRQLCLSEAISTNGLNFNRHFTTYCESTFTLLQCSWRLSGGRVLFAGATSHYELGAAQLVAFTTHSPTEFEFVEKYSPTVFRKTKMLVLA